MLSPKVNYSVLVALVALIWAIANQLIANFPIDPVTFNAAMLAFLLYICAKLGVEVVGVPVANFLRRFRK